MSTSAVPPFNSKVDVNYSPRGAVDADLMFIDQSEDGSTPFVMQK